MITDTKIKSIETPNNISEYLYCLGARRLVKGVGYDKDHYVYLICNGSFMGREKRDFDVTCVADSYDCKSFCRNMILESGKDYELFEIVVTANFKVKEL